MIVRHQTKEKPDIVSNIDSTTKKSSRPKRTFSVESEGVVRVELVLLGRVYVLTQDRDRLQVLHDPGFKPILFETDPEEQSRKL